MISGDIPPNSTKTFKLTVCRADGSIYWVEWANDQAALERWIATEQTRPYWDPTYTFTIEEIK